MSTRKLTILAVFAAALVYFGGLWQRPLLSPDEIRYAEIPREMLVTGNFAVPTLNGLAYYEKPVLGYWLTAAGMTLFGQNRFAVRFPSALFSLLTAGTVFLLGVRGRDRRTGTLACALFLSSGLVFAIGTSAVLDPFFAFFVTAGTAAGYFYHTEKIRRKRLLWLFLAGLFIGCGIMVKGLLAPLLAGSAVAAFFLLKKQYRQLAAAVLPVLAGMAVSALPGALFMHHSAPDFWREFILIEHIRRGLSGAGAADDRAQPPWFYLPVLIGGAMPVLALLPSGIAAVWKKKKAFFLGDDLNCFCFVTALLWFLFFSVARAKLATYILPLFPFLAILAASALLEAEKEGFLYIADRVLTGFCTFLAPAAILFLVWHLLPSVPGKWKLYPAVAAVPPFMTVVLMLLWYSMAAREKDVYPQRKLLYFCIGTAVAMLSVNQLIPFKFLRDADPESFIRRAVMPRLRPGAVILADGGMAAAAAWTLKHPVIVYIKPGEFKNGLDRAGIPPVTPGDLEKMIPETKKSGRQIVVLTRSKNRLKEMPPKKTVVRSGRMAAAFFGGTSR